MISINQSDPRGFFFRMLAVLSCSAVLIIEPIAAQTVSSPGTPGVPSLSKQIETVRHSVVQIAINTCDISHLINAQPTDAYSTYLKKEFLDQRIFPSAPCSKVIIGTGFLIDANGDIVTAAHVIEDAKRFESILDGWKVQSNEIVVFPIDNKEGYGGVRIDNMLEFGSKLVGEDKGNDIAIVTVGKDIFKDHGDDFRPRNMTPAGNATVVILDTNRPQDGDEVFACGFPKQSREMVTTSGHVGSAYFKEGRQFLVDLRANRGDSGAPVFSNTANVPKVIGVIVAIQTPIEAGTVIVVPAHAISAYADRLGLVLP